MNIVSMFGAVFGRKTRPAATPTPPAQPICDAWLKVDVEPGMFSSEYCVSYPPGAHVSETEQAFFVDQAITRNRRVLVSVLHLGEPSVVQLRTDGRLETFNVRRMHLFVEPDRES